MRTLAILCLAPIICSAENLESSSQSATEVIFPNHHYTHSRTTETSVEHTLKRKLLSVNDRENPMPNDIKAEGSQYFHYLNRCCNRADECEDDNCESCCECEEEDYVGGGIGGGGGGGTTGFGGGIGGGGTGSSDDGDSTDGNGTLDLTDGTDAPGTAGNITTDGDVIIPEPSIYMIMAGTLLIALGIRGRKKSQEASQ